MIGNRFTFSETSNIPVDPAPFRSKEITPVSKINIFKSPFTVPSVGCNLKRYVLNDDNEPDFDNLSNLTLIDSGISPLVGFYFSSGAPPGFTQITKFAYLYTGFFFAKHDSAALEIDRVRSKIFQFSSIGFGNIRVQIDNQFVIGYSGYQALDPFTYVQGSKKLIPGRWVQLKIQYYTKPDESGMTVLWKNDFFWNDNSDQFNYGIPISAGVTSSDGSFLEEIQLSAIERISITQSKDEADSMTFSVPLSNSSGTGYYYDRNNDKYVFATNKNIEIKTNYLINCSVGFKDSSGTKEYIKKFTGNIARISPNRQADKDFIDIECVGFENFLNTAINLNYPDKLDYWISGYAGTPHSSGSNPSGDTMPVTFDSFEMTKAVQSLMIRAFIDPVLFIERKDYINFNNAIIPGNFLMERSSPDFIILDKERHYGQPFSVVEVDQIVDSGYILESNFGDFLIDYINKIIDIYGWEWGFSSYHDGAPYLRLRNNPSNTKFLKDGILSGNWSEDLAEIDAMNAIYRTTENAGDYIQYSFLGQRIEVITTMSSLGGTTSLVQSGSSTTAVIVSDGDGSNFSANNRIVVQFDKNFEDSLISSISTDTLTISPALDKTPVPGSFVKTATYKAEVRRGFTWDSAISVLTTYRSTHWDSQDFVSHNQLGWNGIIQPSLNLTGTEYERFFYQGIDPRTTANPCQQLIASGLAYDHYIVRLTRANDDEVQSNGKFGINAIFIYATDFSTPVDTFRTGDSVEAGTVKQYYLDDDPKDQRNDTIVVGRRLGVEVPGSDDNTVINPNNPYFRHIMSRGIDIGSIIDSGARNFVGRPLMTIQIAPEINSQPRADYWAVQFINRYRETGRFPTYTTITNPLLETGDCISVDDEGKSLVRYFDKVWIDSITTDITNTDLVDTIDTGSYEPWPSYTPRKQFDDISVFGDIPIINFTILKSAEGVAPTELSPYDPYTSEESSNFIEITYDLVITSDIKIDIMNDQGKRVATLLNPAGDEGRERDWQRQEIGKNYKVIWDAVDLYGDHNNDTPLSDIITNTEKFYVAEKSGHTTERFSIWITVKPVKGRKQETIKSEDSFDDPNKFIFTQRGEQVTSEVIEYPVFTPFLSTSEQILGEPILDTTGSIISFGARGFYSNDNIDQNGDSLGLSVQYKTTNTKFRPCLLRVDVKTYFTGFFIITLTKADGSKPRNIFKRVIHIAEEQPHDVSSTFKRFSEPLKYNFEPSKYGYSFFTSGEAYYDLTELQLGLSEADLGNEPRTNWTKIDKVSGVMVSWMFKLTFLFTDKSGRFSENNVYARWAGDDRSPSSIFHLFRTSLVSEGVPGETPYTTDDILKQLAIDWTNEDGQGFTGITVTGGVQSLDEVIVILFNYKDII